MPAANEGAGRAWLAASTGLPTDRPPTREEAREVWKRQARGVYDMTNRARGADVAAQRASVVVAVLLALSGAGYIAGLVLLPQGSLTGLLIALHVIAGLVLLLAQVAGPAVMAADAVAEVTAKSAQAWASSPLPTSAWIAGKVVYYLQMQAMATLRVLPIVAASAMLGGLRLREVVVIAVVGLVWTFVAGVGVAAACLEPRPPGRFAAKRGAFGSALGQANPAFRGGTPPAAALAVVQIALGIAGLFIVLPFAFSGLHLSQAPPAVTLFVGAFCVFSPIAAGASAFFPHIGAEIVGRTIPMWMLSLLIGLAWAPLAVTIARLRWRPPDGSFGLGVRPAMLLAWSVSAAVVFGILRRTPMSAAVGLCIVLLAGVALAGLLAGATRLPDLAAAAVRRRDRFWGLDRRTAETHAITTLAAMLIPLVLLAPHGMFSNTHSAVGVLLMAIAVIPGGMVAAGMGREGRRGLARKESGDKERSYLRWFTFVFLIFVLATFAPLVAEVLRAFGFPGMATALSMSALLSPVHLLIALGRDVLGLGLPASSTTVGALAVSLAFGAQLGLALLARRLERRQDDANEPILYQPPPDFS